MANNGIENENPRTFNRALWESASNFPRYLGTGRVEFAKMVYPKRDVTERVEREWDKYGTT